MKDMTVFSNLDTFEAAQRMAKAFTSSTLVPEHFRGDANLGNALIALEMAQRMDMSPLAVLQSLYVVHGRPGWSAQFLIASWNASGKFSPIQYRQVGEPDKPSFGFIAHATVLATGAVIEGPAVTMEIAQRDGWTRKLPGGLCSKYESMPGLMLRYRAATWLIRTVAPEIAMGLQTVEELQDIGTPTERNITPAVDAINASLRASQTATEATVEVDVEEDSNLIDKATADAEGSDTGVDAHCVSWDPAIHASSKALNKDGTWRRKRSTRSNGEGEQPADNAAAEDDVLTPYDQINDSITNAATRADIDNAEAMLEASSLDEEQYAELANLLEVRRDDLKDAPF